MFTPLVAERKKVFALDSACDNGGADLHFVILAA
jgi:hypothetical protein